jgi:hypothetical protein
VNIIHECKVDYDMLCIQNEGEAKLWLVCSLMTCSCDMQDYIKADEWDCICISDWVVKFCPMCGYSPVT